MDLSLTTEEFGQEDRSWLASLDGLRDMASITLDGDLFVALFPAGKVPSGVVLGFVDGDPEAAGPYGGNANEVQTITRTATGGDNDFAFDGEEALAVPVVAATTAAQIKAALISMSNIDAVDVTVTGPAGGPFAITFGGKYAGINVPPITIDDTNATGGTVLIAQTTAGGSAVSDGREVARGHLGTTQTGVTAGKKVTAPLLWEGRVVKNRLPANHGLDANAQAALPNIRYQEA